MNPKPPIRPTTFFALIMLNLLSMAAIGLTAAAVVHNDARRMSDKALEADKALKEAKGTLDYNQHVLKDIEESRSWAQVEQEQQRPAKPGDTFENAVWPRQPWDAVVISSSELKRGEPCDLNSSGRRITVLDVKDDWVLLKTERLDPGDGGTRYNVWSCGDVATVAIPFDMFTSIRSQAVSAHDDKKWMQEALDLFPAEP